MWQSGNDFLRRNIGREESMRAMQRRMTDLALCAKRVAILRRCSDVVDNNCGWHCANNPHKGRADRKRLTGAAVNRALGALNPGTSAIKVLVTLR
jgi:hypothetical protein